MLLPHKNREHYNNIRSWNLIFHRLFNIFSLPFSSSSPHQPVTQSCVLWERLKLLDFCYFHVFIVALILLSIHKYSVCGTVYDTTPEIVPCFTMFYEHRTPSTQINSNKQIWQSSANEQHTFLTLVGDKICCLQFGASTGTKW
jgi:hypothetical protein